MPQSCDEIKSIRKQQGISYRTALRWFRDGTIQGYQRNNQNFVCIPHARFIDMLTYKAQLVGITVLFQEESHTSKCSFLDKEPICHQERYVGKRVTRGLFRASTGRHIHADVNGSYNIIRKAIPDSFGQGIEGVAVRPVGSPTY